MTLTQLYSLPQKMAPAQTGFLFQAPNFAYKLTARKYKEFINKPKGERLDLDFSSVVHMFNAAEPITSSSIDLFCSTFQVCFNVCC
jgi:hypothetical protein